MADIFRFKVSLLSWQCSKYKADSCTRVFDVKGTDSLEKLAMYIVSFYNFDYDHAFGFYDNIKDISKSNEVYTLFADMEDCCDNENEKSVEKTKISTVFKKDKKMLFLFDYGDDWKFELNCISVSEAENGKKYPKLIESKGEAPEQYPDCEEDDYDDDYDDDDYDDEDEIEGEE